MTTGAFVVLTVLAIVVVRRSRGGLTVLRWLVGGLMAVVLLGIWLLTMTPRSVETALGHRD